MATSSITTSHDKVLKNLMVSYIDGEQLASSTLKEKLRLTTPDVRYELLRDVRGVVIDSWTGVLSAAYIHDLEALQVMLDGLSPEQSYNIIKIPNKAGTTPLQWAVYSTTTHCSSIEIVNCLLNTLSQQQKFQLFACKNIHGSSVLHAAAGQNKADVVQLILNSCTKDQKLQLLVERNKGGRSVADLSVPILYTTVQELEETKKAVTDLQTTSDVEKEKLQKTVLQMEQNVAQQTEELQKTNKALADVKKTSGVQVKTNLRLKKDKQEQTKVVEETKKDLAALQETSNKQIEELKKQQAQCLEETKKELADVQKSNNELVVELVRRNIQLESDNNLQTQALQVTRDELKSSQRQIDRLQEKNDEQQQVIQDMTARQAAMEQMLERLELEFSRPIVTDETGDQELEELDE